MNKSYVFLIAALALAVGVGVGRETESTRNEQLEVFLAEWAPSTHSLEAGEDDHRLDEEGAVDPYR